MRFFLAGIMQGSLRESGLHDQQYRERLKRLILKHFPGSDVYDPLADHANSIHYNRRHGREVFFDHNRMCREVDVVVAFAPEASMGTAIEMWEAYRNGRAVVTISPLAKNWAIKFLSHVLFPDVDAFEQALDSGEVARCIDEVFNSGEKK